MSKTYITTSIPYVNGAPHIGHTIDYLLAGTLSRYYRAQGKTVRLQVGTDEHGNKIFKKATEAGLDAQAFADANSRKFRDMIDALAIDYTDFIRTTDADHLRRCQAIWEKLRPHLYKSVYEGWYCEGCECFMSDKEYSACHGICPDHKKPLVRLSEENYYLRVSDFKARICQAIESDAMKITPAFRKKEFLNLFKDLPDVSVSRPKSQVPWGIPVPGDAEQVMYVWMDALPNYLTVLGYPEKDVTDSWPAETQIIGKDILRFHAGIWPCILLGLGLPLPRNLLVHGFITVDGDKMSKSVGNVVAPQTVLDKYGLDPYRYYFLRHFSLFDDADFSWEKYDLSYQELANDLGNLVQRLATLCDKNSVRTVKAPAPAFSAEFSKHMDAYEFNVAFEIVWNKIQALNRRIDAEKPWAVAKTDPEKARALLKDFVRALLSANHELAVFLPLTSAKITAVFGASAIKAPATPLFPRR